jgi:hypothetical protein
MVAYNTGDIDHFRMQFDEVDVADVSVTKAPTPGGMKLTFPLPAGVGSRHTLKLTNKVNGYHQDLPFAYEPPHVLRCNSLKTEGGELTIMGSGFGADAKQVRVSIDGVQCSNVTIASPHSKIHATAPPGVGVNTLRVEVADQHCDAEVTHVAPEIYSIEPPDVDLSGGAIMIVGKNFGTDPDKIAILLGDAELDVADLGLVEPQTRIRCVLPPKPEAIDAGAEVRLRIVVGSIYSPSPFTIVYCPPQGVPATATRPAYTPKRLMPKDPTAASPYADLFATALPVERRKGASGAGAPSVNSPSSSGSARKTPASPQTRGGPSVRVGGTLSGAGPTLSITPPTKWAPNSDNCEVCKKEFGLTLRRHHCRICGSCVCTVCSPHTLQLSPTKPPVRVCTRCHLRVGLLNQMTNVIDSIYTIRKVLPSSMYEMFKSEIIEAVTSQQPTTGASTPSAANGAAAARTPQKSS